MALHVLHTRHGTLVEDLVGAAGCEDCVREVLDNRCGAVPDLPTQLSRPVVVRVVWPHVPGRQTDPSRPLPDVRDPRLGGLMHLPRLASRVMSLRSPCVDLDQTSQFEDLDRQEERTPEEDIAYSPVAEVADSMEQVGYYTWVANCRRRQRGNNMSSIHSILCSIELHSRDS